MPFDVKKHLIKVQGGRDYLPVAYRLVWVREEHPDWSITTSPVVIDVEKGCAILHAEVSNAEGRVVAAGTKMETARGFPDFVEKAETGAIGRALGVLGYGTQFAPEFDEGERLADSPMPIGGPVIAATNGMEMTASVGNFDRHFTVCAECGKPLTTAQETISTRKYGRPLCPAHQRVAVG